MGCKGMMPARSKVAAELATRAIDGGFAGQSGLLDGPLDELALPHGVRPTAHAYGID